ncbi:hypothetical protein [Oceanobacillus massiliensis]|uniref:hypothetical protein n=1 Tax=Oceanobacillus massiliensis TaxID=1465765 RepID=UPI00028801B4|nr:hypothetical protein [Oceanobacillus massiliensis]
MKRLIHAAIIIPFFLLAGCLNPTVVSIVEAAHEAALVENDELVGTYFSDDFMEERSLEGLSDGLAEDVRNSEGVKLMNMKEIKEGQLRQEIVEKFNTRYDGEWNMVAGQTGETFIKVWIVKKENHRYVIVEGEEMDIDTYNEQILK